MIGKAAHIHAAASGPGARRYLASMTREQRTDITNAIWLCATHADLIDRDEVTYTADVLRTMKAEHEAKCAERQRHALSSGEPSPDLIAIGPNIVFVGTFLGVENEVWSFHLKSFFDGDVHTLITFADHYDQTTTNDRYILVNELGDGRALRLNRLSPGIQLAATRFGVRFSRVLPGFQPPTFPRTGHCRIAMT